jgi:MYXO-CTERM domain-containing protein
MAPRNVDDTALAPAPRAQDPATPMNGGGAIAPPAAGGPASAEIAGGCAVGNGPGRPVGSTTLWAALLAIAALTSRCRSRSESRQRDLPRARLP